MIQNSGENKLARASLITFVGLVMALWGNSALAQSRIIPDATMGNENSQVRTNVNIKNIPSEVIEGGAQREANLFHSFSEFNISEGRGAYFDNPGGIANILGRVTGANPSEILGTLGVLGNANLFLINPNGIIFGGNARLDVGGSFVGSTANSVVFGGNFEFSASNPKAPPLLIVNVPIGLQYGKSSDAIRVQGNGQGARITNDLIDTSEALRVGSEQTLALVGSEISLEGATLKTAGGRIELGSVASSDMVSLTQIEKGWVLGYENVQSFGNIQLSEQAIVDASGAGAGDIWMQGRQIRLTGSSQIETSTLAEKDGGSLILKASDLIELVGKLSSDGEIQQSSLVAQIYPLATGNGGTVQIESKHLRLIDGAVIDITTIGEGNAGDLKIQAQSIELIGSVIGTDTIGEGNAGDLKIQAQSIELIGRSIEEGYPSAFSSSVLLGAIGNGGDLQIDTEKLRVFDRSLISTSTSGIGNAGDLKIQAQSIELMGQSTNAKNIIFLTTSVLPGAIGNGGDLQVNTEKLRVTNGSQIITSTFGEGNGGDLKIQAQSIELIGQSTNPKAFSSLTTRGSSTAIGKAGNLRIETKHLLVNDRAEIVTSNSGQGDSGDLIIKTDLLALQNQGKLLASGRGNFSAGDLIITADNITLDNQSSIVADTESGNFGNIILNIQDLLTLRRESQIRTDATGAATGGNITINAPDGFIIAVPEENSDITANARQAKGGRVFIDATNLFGIEPREQTTPESDITATSELGSEFSGTVEINTPDVDPNRGLIQLPTRPLETEVTQACTPGSSGQSEFFITGRGGLPPTPNETLSSDAIGVDLVTLDSDAVEEIEGHGDWETGRLGDGETGGLGDDLELTMGSYSQSQVPSQIIEAQGIIVDENGDVVLVASVPKTSSLSSWQNRADCYGQ